MAQFLQVLRINMTVDPIRLHVQLLPVVLSTSSIACMFLWLADHVVPRLLGRLGSRRPTFFLRV